MDSKLKEILDYVNDWLKFAESKCAAIGAVDLALALAILQVVNGAEDLSPFFVYYLYLVVVLLVTSASLCIISFAPQLQMPWFKGCGKPDPNDNLLFYSHIAKYPPKNYLSKLYTLCNKQKPENLPELELDYAEQIVTNSRIALRKYKYFKSSVWLTVAALLSVPVTFLLYLADKYYKEEQPKD